jgi:hypothetical protein
LLTETLRAAHAAIGTKSPPGVGRERGTFRDGVRPARSGRRGVLQSVGETKR